MQAYCNTSTLLGFHVLYDDFVNCQSQTTVEVDYNFHVCSINTKTLKRDQICSFH